MVIPEGRLVLTTATCDTGHSANLKPGVASHQLCDLGQDSSLLCRTGPSLRFVARNEITKAMHSVNICVYCCNNN